MFGERQKLAAVSLPKWEDLTATKKDTSVMDVPFMENINI